MFDGHSNVSLQIVRDAFVDFRVVLWRALRVSKSINRPRPAGTVCLTVQAQTIVVDRRFLRLLLPWG